MILAQTIIIDSYFHNRPSLLPGGSEVSPLPQLPQLPPLPGGSGLSQLASGSGVQPTGTAK